MQEKKLHVLLIDDYEPTNFLHRMILEETDLVHNISVCLTAQIGLQFLKETDSVPDIIVLDINMPAMTGWEFLEHYQKEGYTKNKSIILMVSSSLNPDDGVRAVDHPLVSAYYSKPMTEENVHEVISRFFQKSTI